MSTALSDDVLGSVLKNGDVIKYIRSENLLAEGTKTGIIRTCMKPKKGEKKYDEKKEGR